MKTDDRARTELHERLDATLGPKAADTLMGYLPPVGWADVATRHDLAYVQGQLETRMDRLETRIDLLEARMDRLETRMDQLEARMDRLEARMDELGARMDELGARMDGLGARMDGLETRMDRLENHLDLKLELFSERLQKEIQRGLRLQLLAIITLIIALGTLVRIF